MSLLISSRINVKINHISCIETKRLSQNIYGWNNISCMETKKKITKCIWLKHDIFENILSIKLSAFTVILELLWLIVYKIMKTRITVRKNFISFYIGFLVSGFFGVILPLTKRKWLSFVFDCIMHVVFLMTLDLRSVL